MFIKRSIELAKNRASDDFCTQWQVSQRVYRRGRIVLDSQPYATEASSASLVICNEPQ